MTLQELDLKAQILKNGSHELKTIKQKGKVARLEEEIAQTTDLDFEKEFDTHIGIAHTRWATHGEPSPPTVTPSAQIPPMNFLCVTMESLQTTKT